MVIANTSLPDNFVEQVLEYARKNKRSVDEAILAILHRPITAEEKWAIIDQAANNSPGVTLNQDIIDRISRGGRL